jgi:hypothetical protein
LRARTEDTGRNRVRITAKDIRNNEGSTKAASIKKKLCEDQCSRLKTKKVLIEDSGVKGKSGENEWKNNILYLITLVPEYQEQ